MDRVFCTSTMLHPLLYNYDLLLISASFFKKCNFSRTWLHSKDHDNTSSYYPGDLEGTEASKRDVVQVTEHGGTRALSLVQL